MNKCKFKCLRTYLIVIFFLCGSLMACTSTETKSMDINIGNTTYSEFIDFLYEYASTNRLNFRWFGWYHSTHANKWFENSEEKSNFKVNMHLLTEENGYLFFSNNFDEKTIDFVIDYGKKPPEWLAVIEDFKKQLAAKGWTTHEFVAP